MGFTSPATGGGEQGAAPAEGAAAKSPDFGQRLGNYFEKRYPVAGGLAGMVFGNDQQQPGVATAPLAPMPGQGQPDQSMIAMNAQPQQGGGLGALLKLFAGMA